jgi:solute:Na+ symporter, SSS family
VVPGVIAFYFFGDTYFDDQDFIYPVLIKKVMPLSLIGFFAAVVLGAILSTFNSVLNSAATIFSLDIYKKLIQPQASNKVLVRVGRLSSVVLALAAILVAPMVGKAPEGLYQLMQQLNGIFFIPIASILVAGFFIPLISPTGAKVGLTTGFAFYIITTFILNLNIHFIHIWGIEFVLNLGVMYLVSLKYPIVDGRKQVQPEVSLNMDHWKYAKPLSFFLCLITVLIYVVLGKFS